MHILYCLYCFTQAQRYRFKHMDMGDLEAKLQEATAKGARIKLVATDGGFLGALTTCSATDGGCPPLMPGHCEFACLGRFLLLCVALWMHQD